ncbi:YigZ family protein [[Mycoplasma] testudinis]|uniref:YigZ family protein n=1 Tax=[Mycoplasma] testudinis TaxID=33924 RepID=UPI000480A813|nr:YigZ family protein [[Mycoplasma] testudinis]
MHEYTINKSRFLAELYDVTSKQEVTSILTDLRKQHKKAIHVVYAYMINSKETGFLAASSDDGEPKGTASKPLLNLLNLKQVVNKLLVVIRYKSGPNLGAGLLMRSYLKAASLCFKDDSKN